MTEYVYVIGAEGVPVVKIGTSADPAARLRNLQTGSPVLLNLVCKVPGTRELETSLHTYFAPQRAHGEWFDLRAFDPVDEAVLAAVAAIKAGTWSGAPAPDHGMCDGCGHPGGEHPEGRRGGRPCGRVDCRCYAFLDPTRKTDFIRTYMEKIKLQYPDVALPESAWPFLVEGMSAPRVRDWDEYAAPEMLCGCGHPMDRHASQLPHYCEWDSAFDECFCSSYEGPLPAFLSAYRPPGSQWHAWRPSTTETTQPPVARNAELFYAALEDAGLHGA